MQRAEKGHDNRGMEQLELASATSWQLSQLCPSQLKWQLRWQWHGSASIHTSYGYGFSQVLARAVTTLDGRWQHRYYRVHEPLYKL